MENAFDGVTKKTAAIHEDGGRAGGRITFAGTPEDLAKQKDNFTGRYLAEELAAMKQ